MSAIDPIVQLAIAATLAWLFMAAAVHKLRDWARFRETLGQFVLVGKAGVPLVAGAIVAAEIVIGIGMLIPIARRTSLACGALLLIVYAIGIGANLMRGQILMDCGCTGFGRRQTLAWWMVKRNLVVAGLAFVGVLPAASRELAATDFLVVGLTALSAIGLYLTQEALAVSWKLAER